MIEFLPYLSALCLIGALVTLFFLSKIDLRDFILPNSLVLTLLCLGLAFHISTGFAFVDLYDIGLGGLIGGGVLFGIRLIANHIYKDDTLGLGDVKLMAAGGIWLGPEAVMMALIVGALAGVFHGLGVAAHHKIKTGEMLSLKKLSIPAGPGFAVGIVLAGVYTFWEYPEVLWP